MRSARRRQRRRTRAVHQCARKKRASNDGEGFPCLSSGLLGLHLLGDNISRSAVAGLGRVLLAGWHNLPELRQVSLPVVKNALALGGPRSLDMLLDEAAELGGPSCRHHALHADNL